VKGDDRSAAPYGGNKPRKLEWILGRARARHASRVMTFGGLGTNHGLATALYAARFGLGCDLVLVHQPVDDSVREKLLLDAALGARIWYGANITGAGLIAAGLLAARPRTFFIPPGGSSPEGTLGFLNAGLELAEQVAAGELPEPARVYVAMGTGGSAAGLAAGLGLAGLPTRVIAVLVTDLLPPNRARLQRTARRALQRLDGRSSPLALDGARMELAIERGFVGPGYGSATPAAEEAVRLARDEEGLRLESTYTGKALAALMARERGKREPVVFWNTYSGELPELQRPDWRTLPRRLHRFFREAG
jgi:D-cysteine desulfhydrase